MKYMLLMHANKQGWDDMPKTWSQQDLGRFLNGQQVWDLGHGHLPTAPPAGNANYNCGIILSIGRRSVCVKVDTCVNCRTTNPTRSRSTSG